MTAVRYPSPGEKKDVVPALSPQELARAIAHQLVLIDKHKVKRPANTDIPALTAWARDHELLTFDLELLQGQRATAAKDVPLPQPKPIIKEIPVTEPEQKLQDILAEIKDATARAGNAFDRPTFRQLYQRVNNLRHKAREIAKKHDLGEPEFPALPVNPFAEPAPMPTLAALAPRVEEESTIPAFCHPEPLEKAGPGPYQEPTAEQIQSVILAAEAHRASLGLPMACCDDCIHPSHHHHSTADLDQRDRFLVNVKVDLTDDLRRLMADADAMLPPWLRQVQAELARARAKFPTAEHRTLALMEEAGEVVKAALDLHNRRPGATLAAVHAEIIQTMAMCVRLLEEGDPAVLGEDVA